MSAKIHTGGVRTPGPAVKVVTTISSKESAKAGSPPAGGAARKAVSRAMPVTMPGSAIGGTAALVNARGRVAASTDPRHPAGSLLRSFGGQSCGPIPLTPVTALPAPRP